MSDHTPESQTNALRAEIERHRKGYEWCKMTIAERDAEIERLRADKAELRALITELYEALDACITWLSSGFAPQSQALALEQADKAKDRYRAAIAKVGK